jgi:hypothetical protein
LSGNKLSALMPIMDVNSFLTGRRGVSLPFTDCCSLIGSPDQAGALFQNAVEFGQQKNWRYLELRSGLPFRQDMPPYASFWTHSLALNQSESALFAQFHDGTRRNIKKAIKNNVTVSFDRTWEAVNQFYRLNCLTRQYHGLPPQPLPFFKNIFDRIVAKGQAVVATARHCGQTIAALFFFLFKDTAIYKYGASDRKFISLRANHLAMWEAIRCLVAKKYALLDFGRTDLNNTGLAQFKRSFGSNELKKHYFRYSFAQKAFVSSSQQMKTSYPFFRSLPLPLLKLSGQWLYRHMG